MSDKPRILTGDTPTGKLHLGHWVGSVENRVALQDAYDCYFLIANKHAFTTRADRTTCGIGAPPSSYGATRLSSPPLSSRTRARRSTCAVKDSLDGTNTPSD